MSYKQRMGHGKFVFDHEIDSYFKELGFEVGTMSPRYITYCQGIVSHRSKALENVFWDSDDNCVHIYMNNREIYIEKSTSYSSYINGWHHIFKSTPSTIAEVEDILEQLVP